MKEEEMKLKEAAVVYTAELPHGNVSEFQPLIDQLYREEVLTARRMSPEQRFLAGEELFDYACAITLAGIRNQNPAFTDNECRLELERRLRLKETLERRQ